MRASLGVRVDHAHNHVGKGRPARILHCVCPYGYIIMVIGGWSPTFEENELTWSLTE